MTNPSLLSPQNDILCFSDLKWESGHQRPHHLMSRFARQRRVFFVQEPSYSDHPSPAVTTSVCPSTGVHVVTTSLPSAYRSVGNRLLAEMLSGFAVVHQIERPLVWTCTPAPLDWLTSRLSPKAIVYDCAAEAPAYLEAGEQRLCQSADLVFTAGFSLLQSKRRLHPRMYCVPNGVDIRHFSRARAIQDCPADQRDIARPRLGFAGKARNAIDPEVIRGIAECQPEWHIVMLDDPVGGLNLPNIHWLGEKRYEDLPCYFSGWDIAIMPFVQDATVRDRNPVSTPEYLAAGLPVVSSPIVDVMQPYGDLGLVRLASHVEDFVGEAEHAMVYGMSLKWRERADRFLRTLSWDEAWSEMNRVMENVLQPREELPSPVLLAAPLAAPAKTVMH